MRHTVITIGRQYGSGGREIGKLIAEELGVPFYDRELLARAARDSGICENMMEYYDERPVNSLLYTLAADVYSTGFNNMSFQQQVMQAQCETIRSIARSSCVIVGRGADYILEGDEALSSVFILGDMECRIKRICERHKVDRATAAALIKKTDKRRASYYQYQTDKKWGDSSSYHLCVNSSVLGIEKTARFILEFVNLR